MRTWYGRKVPEPLTAAATPITAAAVTVAINNPPSHVLWGGAQWQREFWQHYDTSPEVHKALSIYGYAFSQAKMIAVDVDPMTLELGEEPTKDPVALALVARLFGGPTGRSQAQRQMGVHLTGPGECWILAEDQQPDADAQPWRILSVAEVTKAGNLIRIQNLDGTQRTLLETELLFRLFNPHPFMAWQADSPNRAALPVLRELAGLSMHVIASIKSRLASAGIWLLPKSAQMEKTIDQFGQEVPGGADGWMRLLADAMLAPIADPDNPSAVVPIVAMVPDEVLAQIKDPITFVTEIMQEIAPLRQAARERYAAGQDMDPSQLLGAGEVNHWSNWFIDEAFVKGPLAALLALPADAFTTHYLRPGLRLANRDPRLFAIRFDTNHMIEQDLEKNAMWAYENGLISEAATLSALHFDPVRDLITEEERERSLLEKMIARGNPQTVEELAALIKLRYPDFVITPLPTAATGPNAPAPPAIGTTAPPAPKAIAAPVPSSTQAPPVRPPVTSNPTGPPSP